MSVLLFAENSNGEFKKATFEAASYGYGVAEQAGVELHAVAFGNINDGQFDELGKYGVSKVHHIADHDTFQDSIYATGVAAVVNQCGASVVVMAQSYNGRPLAARLAIKLDAGFLSGVTTLVAQQGGGWTASRASNSGKGIQTVTSAREKTVITVKTNSYGLKENATGVTVESFSFEAPSVSIKPVEMVKTSSTLSITEADTVVSGGRGFKGPENWDLLLELATELHAGTACSKPVADMDWRPHHEHVGQTGIQIGPNLYIAIGISGAIQHLAGVNSSKNIVVINKDPDAPFFKIADYGIVGDLFEVVPKMTEAVKAAKASS